MPTRSWGFTESALTPPRAPSPPLCVCLCVSVPLCCHSDAHLSQRSNSRTELVRADFTDSSAGGERFTLRASTLFSRGGQQHRDAPLDRGSVSVKSEKENETEKRAQRSGPVSTASTTTLRGGSGELGECKHTDALGYLLFFWGFGLNGAARALITAEDMRMWRGTKSSAAVLRGWVSIHPSIHSTPLQVYTPLFMLQKPGLWQWITCCGCAASLSLWSWL